MPSELPQPLQVTAIRESPGPTLSTASVHPGPVIHGAREGGGPTRDPPSWCREEVQPSELFYNQSDFEIEILFWLDFNILT